MDEHKKIDLDAPLLSIRRFSVEPPTSSFTTSNSNSLKQAHKRSSLPFYKPDIKSGPVRNPGVIPFVWEQRPGQPKPSTNSPSRPPFVAPRPPPVKMGSSVRTRKPVSNYSSSAKNAKDPYFDDFSYPNNERLEEKQEKEQIEEEEKFDKPPQVVPETAQTELKSAICNGNHQTQETEKEKQVKEQVEKEIKKREQEQKQKEMRDKFEEEEEEDEDEDEEDNFSDALDTLSRAESFFMNCSVSGLSELPAGTKPSPFPGASDPDAREFMIDRFLPAAQAVATGSPQYTFRKAPVPAREVAKPAQTFVGTGINPSQRRVPVPLPYQNQPKYENSFEEEEEEEEEDEDEEDDDEEDFEESRRFSAKGCGFLPSFCMKGSLLMMNPVPGMKARGKVMPPRGGAGRRAGSPLIRSSNNESDSKHSDEAFENYMHSWEPVYKHKQDQRSNSSMKINDSSKIINSETSHLTYWSDSPNTGGGSSPLIHSTGNSLEKIECKSSPAVPSHCSSQNRSSSLDRDPDRFLDAQDSNPSEAASATEEVENVVEVKKNSGDWVLPVQLLPLPLPKSPTESWLSRTLPSVSGKKQPVSSFLGMQVQSKKQGLRENEMKFSGPPRQIQFSEVLERPASVQSEI